MTRKKQMEKMNKIKKRKNGRHRDTYTRQRIDEPIDAFHCEKDTCIAPINNIINKKVYPKSVAKRRMQVESREIESSSVYGVII